VLRKLPREFYFPHPACVYGYGNIIMCLYTTMDVASSPRRAILNIINTLGILLRLIGRYVDAIVRNRWCVVPG
jgi:hypothetical protein